MNWSGWKGIFSTWRALSATEKAFLWAAMLCGFVISADYAIVRPSSNSIFLGCFPSDFLPYAWLLSVPLNFCIVSLYGRYLPVLGCVRVFGAMILLIVGGNVLAATQMLEYPSIAFVHFLWKEIYILLLFQGLWSVIHATVRFEQAKSLYGMVFAVGGLGGVCGSIVPSLLAIPMGSENLLYFSAPLCTGLFFMYQRAVRLSEKIQGTITTHQGGAKAASLGAGWNLVFRSPTLPFLLALVVFMQVSATLLDYQFNAYLQVAYPWQNVRTEFMGQLGSVISTCTIIMQSIGAYVVLRWVGVQGGHLITPIILFLNSLGMLIFPGTGMIAHCFASAKVLDFSLFGVAREMLYLRLSLLEKFQAKAVIDVFACRASKAFASAVILGLQTIHCAESHYLTSASLGICVLWICVVILLFRRCHVEPLELGASKEIISQP